MSLSDGKIDLLFTCWGWFSWDGADIGSRVWMENDRMKDGLCGRVHSSGRQ